MYTSFLHIYTNPIHVQYLHWGVCFIDAMLRGSGQCYCSHQYLACSLMSSFKGERADDWERFKSEALAKCLVDFEARRSEIRPWQRKRGWITNCWSDWAPFTFSSESPGVKSAHIVSFIIFFVKNISGQKYIDEETQAFFFCLFFFAWGQNPWANEESVDFKITLCTWSSCLKGSCQCFHFIFQYNWQEMLESMSRTNPRTGYWCVDENPLCECRRRRRRGRMVVTTRS